MKLLLVNFKFGHRNTEDVVHVQMSRIRSINIEKIYKIGSYSKSKVV